VSEEAGDGLIRLPLDSHITPAEQERVVATLLDGLRQADTAPLRQVSPADAP
jgi:dTDP-4-amino-4,6-dideoxygalactose transaminase